MIEPITAFISQLYDIPALIRTVGYVGLAFIIFAETGLFFGFFLPGDSLLVSAGLFAATGQLNIALLLVILVPAAIIGDAVGYTFGARVGKSLYNRKSSMLFRREHLEAAKAFYDKHGGKTIVLARFVPVIRTFAPIVAGAAEMPYHTFFMFNALGGALWVGGMLLLGFFLGSVIPDIEKNVLIVVAIVVAISLIPVVLEWYKMRHKKR